MDSQFQTPEDIPASGVSSAELIDLIVNNIPQAAFWKDRGLIYRWCNSTFARNAGLARWQDIVGLTDYELPWTPSQSRAYREMDRTVIDNDKSMLAIIERQKYASGHEAWLVTNKVPLHDAQGNVLGVLGTVEDVTELHRTKEALRRINGSLEERVRERTAELSFVNEQLKRQILERERAVQAQLHSEEREEQQRIVAEALQSTSRLLSNTLDLEEVLRRLLVTVGSVVRYDSSAVLLIRENMATLVKRWPSGGWQSEGAAPMPLADLLPPDASAAMFRSGSYVQHHGDPGFAEWQALHANADVTEILCVPIVADDTLIGLISVGADSPRAFASDTATLLGAFANQAAAAIRNADLYRQAQTLAAIEERQRIARDLHDAVSQTLWSASMLVDVLPNLVDTPGADWRNVAEQLQQLVRGALSEMRTLLWELRPESIANVELGDLLSQLSKAVMCRRALEINVEVSGEDKLPDDVIYAVYRIVQEALTNVVKHADADNVTITVHYDSRALSLTVVDDGCGFDSAKVYKSGIGFDTMAERARGIGGEITIQAQPDAGTRVLLNWSR